MYVYSHKNATLMAIVEMCAIQDTMEVGTLPDLDFFAKMKALSEQEQDTVGPLVPAHHINSS